MIDVTQFYCPESGGKEGEPNTTHHLIATGSAAPAQICRYCGKTAHELRTIHNG